MTPVELVHHFYEDIWNKQDYSQIPILLRKDLVFHGSLGQDKRGLSEFADYVRMVTTALDDYCCTVEELIVEENKAFAKMLFEGVHQGDLMGYAPTGKPVCWAGAALFTCKAGKIAELWVQGDVYGLLSQLENAKSLVEK
ncbi:MAG: ester cyclase [Symploca sp. SIO1B1]|nr:ester cyclase [Symploca sp. SIO1B1]